MTVIGIIDASIINQLSKAAEYRGSMSQEEIFNISAEFDGLLLPYKQDAFSTTISPAKFYECLVMDRLIITRSDLRIFEGYEDYILKLNDLDRVDYDALRSSVDQYDVNLCLKSVQAHEHTWEDRLKQLDIFLQEELNFDNLTREAQFHDARANVESEGEQTGLCVFIYAGCNANPSYAL